MPIREATSEDWPAIWQILRQVGTAGETLTWDPQATDERAQAGWMRKRPGRTVVAVWDDGNVIGSAQTHPNHSGPGSHVANAGGSRLVACLDVTARSWAGRLRTDLLAVGDLVMMRKQLLNLKGLAECSAVAA